MRAGGCVFACTLPSCTTHLGERCVQCTNTRWFSSALGSGGRWTRVPGVTWPSTSALRQKFGLLLPCPRCPPTHRPLCTQVKRSNSQPHKVRSSENAAAATSTQLLYEHTAATALASQRIRLASSGWHLTMSPPSLVANGAVGCVPSLACELLGAPAEAPLDPRDEAAWAQHVPATNIDAKDMHAAAQGHAPSAASTLRLTTQGTTRPTHLATHWPPPAEL